MKVKVSGQYRHDVPGHTEQGQQPYSVEFELKHFNRGEIIALAFKLVRVKDPSADSLMTHVIEVIEDAGQPGQPTSEPVSAPDAGADSSTLFS